MTRKSIPDPRARRALFKRRLLAWFRRTGRDLPWRRTRDPYAVLVSEFMLQQTQVSRVEGYWPRFLARFPTVADLALAKLHHVHEAWAGLGYYARADNLHRLARTVVRDHDSRIPDDLPTLRALPGVGAYTAGAVMSFAFELPEPAIDTNVERVLRRAFHPRLPTGAAADRRLHATAQELLPRAGAAAWATNQALMELGALICTARVKHCEICPVRAACLTGSRQPRAVACRTSSVRSRSRGKV
jgi:A/G-specific adenine glycosylase